MTKQTLLEYISWKKGGGQHPELMDKSDASTKDDESFCVAGFLIQENDEYIEISSTQDIHTQGAEDILKIAKKNILTRKRLRYM